MAVMRSNHRVGGLRLVSEARAPGDAACLALSALLVDLRNVAVLEEPVIVILLLVRVHHLLIVLLTFIVQLVDGAFFIPALSEALHCRGSLRRPLAASDIERVAAHRPELLGLLLLLFLIQIKCRQLLLVLRDQRIILVDVLLEIVHAVVVRAAAASLVVGLVQRTIAAMQTKERVDVVVRVRPAMALLCVTLTHRTIAVFRFLISHRARLPLFRVAAREKRRLPRVPQRWPRRTHLTLLELVVMRILLIIHRPGAG